MSGSDIKSLKLLTKVDFNYAWTYFEYNCYTLHPEWLLISMLSDPNEAIRKMAVDKILHYRFTVVIGFSIPLSVNIGALSPVNINNHSRSFKKFCLISFPSHIVTIRADNINNVDSCMWPFDKTWTSLSPKLDPCIC